MMPRRAGLRVHGDSLEFGVSRLHAARAIGLICLVLTGCGGGESSESPGGSTPVAPAAVARIVLSADSLSMRLGESRTLTASLLDAQGNSLAGRAVSWSSDNPAVVAVDQSGLTRALSPGAARVSASAAGRTAVIPVSVQRPPTPATVRVLPALAALDEGDTLALDALVRDEAGTLLGDATVDWASSDTVQGVVFLPHGSTSGFRRTIRAVPEVNERTVLNTRVVNVRALAGAAASVALITVRPMVRGIGVDPLTSPDIRLGGTARYQVELSNGRFRPLTDLSGRTIVWRSSDPRIATVTATGPGTAVASGVSSGRAMIEAHYYSPQEQTTSPSNASASHYISVSARPAVAALKPTPTELFCPRGTDLSLKVEVRSSADVVLADTVSFTSSNGAATLRASGPQSATVSCVAVGDAVITAASGGISVKVPIDVRLR